MQNSKLQLFPSFHKHASVNAWDGQVGSSLSETFVILSLNLGNAWKGLAIFGPRCTDVISYLILELYFSTFSVFLFWLGVIYPKSNFSGWIHLPRCSFALLSDTSLSEISSSFVSKVGLTGSATVKLRCNEWSWMVVGTLKRHCERKCYENVKFPRFLSSLVHRRIGSVTMKTRHVQWVILNESSYTENTLRKKVFIFPLGVAWIHQRYQFGPGWISSKGFLCSPNKYA